MSHDSVCMLLYENIAVNLDMQMIVGVESMRKMIYDFEFASSSPWCFENKMSRGEWSAPHLPLFLSEATKQKRKTQKQYNSHKYSRAYSEHLSSKETNLWYNRFVRPSTLLIGMELK